MAVGRQIEFDNWMMQYQPVGFLQQLGEALKDTVGLSYRVTTGTYYFPNLGPEDRKSVGFEVTSRVWKRGLYDIIFDRDSDSVDRITFWGPHPLDPDRPNISLEAVYRNGQFERTDDYHNIDFPGLIQNEQPNFKFWPSRAEIDLSEISPEKIYVTRNPELRRENHTHNSDGTCDIHYDVWLQKVAEEVPLGYVALVLSDAGKWNREYRRSDLYQQLRQDGFSDRDKVPMSNWFEPAYNLLESWEEGDEYAGLLVRQIGENVLGDILGDLKSQGYKGFHFGALTEFEEAQIERALQTYNFGKYGGLFYASLSNVEANPVPLRLPYIASPAIYAGEVHPPKGLTGEQRTLLIEFAKGKPNINLGPTQISELCKNLSERDFVDMAQYLGVPEQDVSNFLADRLSSVVLRGDFQRNPEYAKEAITRLKELGE